MPTKRKRLTRNRIEEWRPKMPLLHFFFTGQFVAGLGAEDPDAFFELMDVTAREETTAEKWAIVREAGILEAWWIPQHPGTRPFMWWALEAPEPRRRLGGVGDPFPNSDCGRRFGIPANWTDQWQADYYNGRSIKPEQRCCWNADYVEGHFRNVPVDWKNPPLFESQASYLARLGLLTDAERAALKPADFAPEPLEPPEPRFVTLNPEAVK